MSSQTAVAFPDTNLFLHYRPLNEIDWCQLLQAAAVEIKIAPVVARELEEQKTLNPSRKLRDRAASALKFLHKHLSQREVRDGVTLAFLIDEPTSELAASRNLNLQIEDDRLIGTIFLYRDENPDVRCVLVTNDLSLTVKAKHHRVEIVSPSETLQLPSDPDPLERKNKQLEAELHRLKLREPVLDIRFEDGGDHARFRIKPNSDDSESEPEIQSKLAAIKEKTPLVVLRPPQPELDPSAVANSPFAEIVETMRKITEPFESIGRQFHEDYNTRVTTYYRNFETYLRATAAFKTLKTRTIWLKLLLRNGGTCPAEDIHILLHFPDGVMPYDEEHPPKEPKEPRAPSKEMNPFPSSYLVPSLPNIRAGLPGLPNPNLPRIRKTNSYEVTFHCEKLKHGFVWNLMALYAVFDSAESAKSFSIDYTIHAGNMIDEQTGQLGVVIEKV
jgi:hypothetical protein